MNLLNRIVALFMVIIMCGCASPNVKPNISVEQLVKSNKAVVVFSIAQPLQSEGYGDSLFRLTPMGSFNSIYATSHDIMNPFNGTPPSEFNDRYGRVATLELAPGEYQVDWMFSDGHGHFSVRGGPEKNVIRVEAGEVVYVGALAIELQFGKSLFRKVFGAAGSLSDESVRDIPLFQKKYPKLGKPQIRLFRLGPIVSDTSNVLDAVK
jgi:hypothetical protein